MEMDEADGALRQRERRERGSNGAIPALAIRAAPLQMRGIASFRRHHPAYRRIGF